MRPTILLFDVDGTLVDTEGAGRRAIEKAFAAVTGRSDACDAFRFGGMTDRLIVRTGLRAIEYQEDDATIAEVLDAYVGFLELELASTRGSRVLPGAAALVATTASHEDVAVGLGTGNIRRGATLKLDCVSFEHAFAFGGFGCDHENRSDLLRIGRDRGAALLGRSASACRVVVIGDTPRDVSAAKELGAQCVAVATGTYRTADLVAAGAELVVNELTDARCLDVLLQSA